MTFPPAPLALAPGPLEPAPPAPTEMETLPAPAVDGAVEFVDETGSDIERFLGLFGRRDGSGEDDLVRDRADVDVIIRNRGVEEA